MPMSYLFAVSNINTYITVTSDKIFAPKYTGKFIDIPVELLETTVKSITAVSHNRLLVTVA